MGVAQQPGGHKRQTFGIRESYFLDDEMKRFDAVEMICEAIDAEDTLSQKEKEFAKFSVRFRPFVRMRAKRLVTEKMEDAQALTEDGQHVAEQFDWMELIKLLLPILLMFI